MATIGIIGAGHIGAQLARLALASGYDVVISNSRGPETLSDLIKELGPRARAATPAEAARSWFPSRSRTTGPSPSSASRARS